MESMKFNIKVRERNIFRGKYRAMRCTIIAMIPICILLEDMIKTNDVALKMLTTPVIY